MRHCPLLHGIKVNPITAFYHLFYPTRTGSNFVMITLINIFFRINYCSLLHADSIYILVKRANILNEIYINKGFLTKVSCLGTVTK